jgi:5-(carboxyamino)imidazole ribonucleotide synthase
MKKQLPLGSNIGIIGGGQLGRMTAIAAAQLGYHAHIFTPEANSPASEVAKSTIVAPYDDENALRQFASNVDVITNEFENIPSQTADLLASIKPLYPSPKLFATCQNRILEKQFIKECGAQVAPYAVASSLEKLKQAVRQIGTPCLAKRTSFGYDGKGQMRINSLEECEIAWHNLQGELIIEAHVKFEREASIIIARSQNGEMQFFPIAENIHEGGILRRSFAPANISDSVANQMQQIARNIAIQGELIGILAVECFILANDVVLVNELAARPHNSGHFTMDGCNISQFEMLVRICAGLPLIAPKLLHPTTMHNLLGDEVNHLEPYLSNPNARLHLYGKHEATSGRKMAHVNIISKN